MNKLRSIFVFLLLISTPSIMFAQGEGGLAGAFLRMGLGPKAVSMGGAHVAIADDGFGAFYNPGGLPFLSKRHFATTYSFLSLDRQFHYISYSQNLKPSAGVSLYWLGAGIDNIDGRDLSGNQTNMFSESKNVFGLSFANRFHERLAIGVTMKILAQSFDLVDEGLSTNDLAFDAGVMFIPTDDIKIGVTVKDFNGNFNWNTQELFSLGTTSTDSLPYLVHTGISYQVSNNLLLSSTMEFNQLQQERFRIGAEFRGGDLYSLRIGANDSDISFGLGLFYSASDKVDTIIDYAFRPEIVGEGGTHMFSWEFIF